MTTLFTKSGNPTKSLNIKECIKSVLSDIYEIYTSKEAAEKENKAFRSIAKVIPIVIIYKA